MPPCPVRDMLLRLSVIEWGHGRTHSIYWYQREGKPIAGRTVIRTEIMRLVSRGALSIGPSPDSRKALLVRPTRKLLDFYATQMPRLREIVQSLFVP